MFHVFACMTFGFQEAIKQQGGGSAAEFDGGRAASCQVETHPVVLGSNWRRERAPRGVSWPGLRAPVIFTPSFRFEMLAFKSDVSHWRKKDELTGVSVRYVFSDMISFMSIDLTNVERYVLMLSGGMLCIPKFLLSPDHHERLRAAGHFTISH